MAPEAWAVLARVITVWRARGLSAATVRLYGDAAARWLAFGGQPGHCDRGLLTAWLLGLRGRVSAATLSIHLRGVRAFYAAAVVAGVAVGDQRDAFPRLRRAPARLVADYDIAEVRQLLAAPPADTWTGRRDRALLRVLYESGIRAGELAGLHVGDVLPDGWLHVRGKGGRCRYVPICANLQIDLVRLDAERAASGARRGGALFVTRHGKPLAGAGAVWRIVHRYARASLSPAPRGGPARPWQGHYPHRLRASIATHLRTAGMPLPAIAELLRHADLSTTARYVAVDLEGMRAALAMHPRLRRR